MERSRRECRSSRKFNSSSPTHRSCALLKSAEEVLKEGLKDISTSTHLELVTISWPFSGYFDDKAPTLVISLNHEETFREEINKMLYNHFIPHKAFIWRRDTDEELRDLAPVKP